MKVVLYYPPVTPYTSFPTWEPLQLIFLKRVLKESNIDVEIIDERLLSKGNLDDVIKQKISTDTVCFGITSLTCYQLINAFN